MAAEAAYEAKARVGVTFPSPWFERCDNGMVRNHMSLGILEFMGWCKFDRLAFLRWPVVGLEDFDMDHCYKILSVVTKEWQESAAERQVMNTYKNLQNDDLWN